MVLSHAVRPFLIAAGSTLALAPFVRAALLRHARLDLPNERSSHSMPTPRGAGIAIGLATIVALVGERWVEVLVAVVASSCALGVVGFADDSSSIRPLARLTAQILIPASVLPLLLHGMPLDHWWTWLFAGGVVVWCATYVNAFNFMDGINGMAVGQTVVAGLGVIALGARWSSATLIALGASIAGGGLGFAPFNVPNARLFLGDVGSYFVGCWLATTVVVALRTGIPPEIIIAPFLLYLLDTGHTLLRRWRRGERLFNAHREHAYQRLTQHGWSHTRVSLLAATTMALGTATTVAAAKSAPAFRAAALVVALALAAAFVMLPSMMVQRRGAMS